MPHILYQIHTRIWLRNLAHSLGCPATLDDIPEAELSRLAGQGFDWLYLLGVWQTGPLGFELALANHPLRQQIQQVLPDASDSDICSSCFAITGYTVPPEWGGDAALQRLHQRLHRHGLRLMLDFIPNHTALDHPWAQEHPEYYVPGSPAALRHAPRNYIKLQTRSGACLLAHGRDPYFPAWSDTLQLNYSQPELQAAMSDELMKAASLCDGLRCDMAMLVLPEIFERTWGLASQPFWPEAIARVKHSRPNFTFLAEVYWDLEAVLLEQGFDYAYDKLLYDRLREQRAGPVRDHLSDKTGYQACLAHFLENHDEPRAAASFSSGPHQAAALVTFFAPGLRFFQQGQLEGSRLRLLVQLCRTPVETPDAWVQSFYRRLLAALAVAQPQPGSWQLLTPAHAWQGNGSWDDFIGYSWDGVDGKHWLAAINYAPHRSQAYLNLPFPAAGGMTVQLRDWFSPAVYDRSGDELLENGLFLDLPEWGYHLFEITISP